MKYMKLYEVDFFQERKNIHEELKKNYSENSIPKKFLNENVYGFESGVAFSKPHSKKYEDIVGIIGDQKGDIKSKLERELKCTLKELNALDK